MSRITEQELINDLKKQIEDSKSLPNIETILSISNHEIDFVFNFKNILKEFITEKDENNSLICPYHIHFIGTSFSRSVIFRDIIFSQNIEFIGTTFSKSMKFMSTIFSRTVLFIDTTFSQNVEFINTIFNQDMKFMSAIFSQNVNFYGTIFEQEASFWDIKSEQIIEFNDIKMNTAKSYLTFRNINYDYKTQNFSDTPKESTIAIVNTVMNGRIDFHNVSINKIDLSNTVVVSNGVLITDNLIIKNYDSWKTARFLKHEAIKVSNTVESLKFHAEEKDLHRKDSWKNHKYGEWLSLLLSKVVNNHGQSWFQAFCFTLVVWILSFTFFYMPFSSFFSGNYWYYVLNSGEYFSKIFEYLVPTNYTQIQEYFELTDLWIWTRLGGGFWYMLGKIFVPYGIFEIIKAFRKYR